MRMQRLDQGDERLDLPVKPLRVDTRRLIGQWELRSREREQRAALGLIEPKRASEGIEHLRRGIDVASLLKPGVPRHANPSQRSKLLAPQARRTAAPVIVRQPDVRRRQAGPPRPQERPQLTAPNR